MKKFLSVFLTIAFIISFTLPSFAVDTPTQKEEVVYGILGLDGKVQSIYVVNSFAGGMITDYGNYRGIKNMTSSEKLTQKDDMIKINTSADPFYYQGTLKSKELPWNMAIKYKLDGKEISASELAGKSGALSINLAIKQNKTAQRTFNEDYTLQISLTLDTEKCWNIASPNGTIAKAGKNKKIIHMVMPGKNADITVTANVRNFTMSGIEITAMPLSVFIEMPDIKSLTKDLTNLSDAVNSLNVGAQKLSAGLDEAYLGALKLDKGSSDFADGLSELSDNSGDLLNGSAQIKTALADIVGMLENVEVETNLGGLATLSDGLRQLVDGLNEITYGLQTLKKSHATAYSALDSTIATIPNTDVDPTALYTVAQGNEELIASLDQLVKYYVAAKTVKQTYAAVQEGFASVDSSLDIASSSIDSIVQILWEMAYEIQQDLNEMDPTEQLKELKDGLSELSNHYDEFHEGLEEYISGVKSLSDGYDEVDTGIKSLADGIGELNTGAKDLSEGTGKLNKEVANLPDIIQDKMEEFTKKYDKTGLVPVSFVSKKNTNVALVQFVLKTDSLELPEGHQSTTTKPAKLTLWEKILNLFNRLLHRDIIGAK